MATRDIIVIGASAGGVEALTTLVRHLPADLTAAVFVVLHVPPDGFSVLPQLLTRAGPLPAFHPKDKEQIQNGHIYVAPPDNHLLVKRGYLRLVRGPKENRRRPSIDPLFRTAARAYGNRVMGIILSGTLDDGSAGLIAIKKQGGIAIIQDPEEALYPGMPANAIESLDADYILPVSGIASVLARLTRERVEERGGPESEQLETESDIAELDFESMHKYDRPGTPSRFTCPECHGVLWEIDDERLLRFRCRVGHAYSSENLLGGQADAVEDALWAALRTLEENVALLQRIADRMQKEKPGSDVRSFCAPCSES
ncbi:MAG TPA: chemotaxis protein CheB [Blastocatellia bacterium]|nr:chemotaxis protein CheB [Blastocatellia bacterium]